LAGIRQVYTEIPFGGFVTSYIIFRNAEISENCFLKEQTCVKENEESFGIFQNIIFFKMGSSKLINK
jgi:hypothetical protein